MTRWLMLAVGATAGFAACAMPPTNQLKSRGGSSGTSDVAPADAGTATPATIQPPILPIDGFVTLNNPADAHTELCTNDGAHPKFPDDADLITATFCQDVKPGGVMPTPKSLADLQKQLGLEFKDRNGGNGTGGNPGFAILGHSSALTARKVSTITPTAFVFTPPPADGSKPSGQYVVLAFDPGEQFVEVASYDPTGAVMNFYLVLFDQACTSAPGGCTTNDLLTPKLITGWSNVRVYEDTTSLGNTIFDCHVCHQPVDKADPFMRMQEITTPFTHWFSGGTDGGRALLSDFHAAHGTTEDYGPIPSTLIDKSDPGKLAQLIGQAGAGQQPNAFDSATIEHDIATAWPKQPAVNVPAGWSKTWQSLYDEAAAGKFIAPPYHDVKVTDPDKLTTATKAYQAWMGGSTALLPDLRDVFLDEGLRDMGFAAKAGADGNALLTQLCQQCHNANLDMTLTRENFLVDKLATMTRVEKDLAIDRLNLPITNRLHMPPSLFRTMTDDERQLMIDELRK